MESNFVIFQVEKKLFRIPTYLLANESQVFEGLFTLPPPDGDNVEGSTPSNPIILPDEFRCEDFKNLMKALYPRSFSLRLFLSTSEWISVLKLSTKWYFLDLRAMAISELERMQELPSIEKITLGRKNRIYSWVIEGFYELVQRDGTITDEEAKDVDYDYPMTAYKLFRAREQRLKQTRFGTPANLETEEIFKHEVDISYKLLRAREQWIQQFGRPVNLKIEEIFKHEPDSIRADEEGFKSPDKEIAFEPAGVDSATPNLFAGYGHWVPSRLWTPANDDNDDDYGWGAGA